MSIAVQQMFDRISGRYDFLNHFLSLSRDVRWRKRACKMAGPAKNVLDLCGGTGDFLMTYQNMWQSKQPVQGMIGDFSMGMLAIAQKKQPDLALIQLDAMQIPLRDSTQDLVLCGFGMRNLDSTKAGFLEVARTLHSGGTFVVLEFFKPDNLFTKFFYGVLGPIFIPLLGAVFSGRREAYDYLVKSVKRFLTVADFAKLGEQTGFKCETIKALDGGIAHLVVFKKI